MSVLNILLAEQMATAGDRWYKVLEAGTMYSKKYSGFLTADPARCVLEEKPGKLVIEASYLAAIHAAFEADAHETIPYIDVNHDRDQSCGNIRATRLDNGGAVLSLAIDWNDKGAGLVGKDKNGVYRYLSVAVSDHLHSKTGQHWPFVLKAASLTNDPVFKDQEILSMSELSTDKGNGKGANRRSNNMDKIKEIFAKLVADVKAALTGVDEATGKTALKEAVMDLISQLGISMDAPTEMACDPAKKEAEMKASETANRVNSELSVKMSELAKSNIELADRVTKAENKAMRLEFNEKWGSRFSPADVEDAFTFYQKDAAFAEKQFAKMPVIQLGEIGHGGDTKIVTDKTGAASTIAFTDAVKKLATEKGIQFNEAYEMAKGVHKDLYAAMK